MTDKQNKVQYLCNIRFIYNPPIRCISAYLLTNQHQQFVGCAETQDVVGGRGAADRKERFLGGNLIR